MFLGFIKIVVDNNREYFLFSKIYNVLFKLYESDKGNIIGNI